MTTPGRAGERRLAVGLAVSFLLHVGAAGALYTMHAVGLQDRPQSVENTRGEMPPAVRVTLVHVAPRTQPQPVQPKAMPPREEPPPDPVAPAEPQPLPTVEPPPPKVAATAAEPVIARIAPDATSSLPVSPPAAPAVMPETAPAGPPGLGGPPAAAPGRAEGPSEGSPRPAAVVPERQRALVAAEVVSLPTPEYPPRSRRLGEEGLVVLEVEVLPNGRAGDVRILQAPDYPRLVAAAIEAVRQAQFKPATSDGTPIRSLIEIPVRFQLR